MRTSVAMTYNDISVLENYHLFNAFCVLNTGESNFYDKLSPIEYTQSREQVISMVLSTDMAFHGVVLATFKLKCNSKEFDPGQGEDKQIILNMICHSCDVSNPIKKFDVYRNWIDRVFEEFFNQVCISN